MLDRHRGAFVTGGIHRRRNEFDVRLGTGPRLFAQFQAALDDLKDRFAHQFGPEDMAAVLSRPPRRNCSVRLTTMNVRERPAVATAVS